VTGYTEHVDNAKDAADGHFEVIEETPEQRRARQQRAFSGAESIARVSDSQRQSIRGPISRTAG
jgi:hypothetical protein